jgi:hypothetical protein
MLYIFKGAVSSSVESNDGYGALTKGEQEALLPTL